MNASLIVKIVRRYVFGFALTASGVLTEFLEETPGFNWNADEFFMLTAFRL